MGKPDLGRLIARTMVPPAEGRTIEVITGEILDMEANGLVHRQVYAEVPPRVEYSLTELGRSLKPILDAMWTWGEGYKAQNS